jgi:proton glutamate symport protein
MVAGVNSQTAMARKRSATAWSLTALAGGLAAGFLLRRAGHAWSDPVTAIVAPIGQIWIGTLRIIVIPLVVTQTLTAVAGVRREASVAALAGRALLMFGVMLLAGGLFAFLVAAPAVSLLPADPSTAAALQPAPSGPVGAAATGRPTASPTLESFLDELLPKSIFQAAANGSILPVLLFTMAFGLAAAHLPSPRREALEDIFRSLAEAMMVLVGWVLKALPLGVFAVSYGVTVRGGGAGLGGFLLFYVALVCGVLLLETALLYPVTSLLARVSVRRFARAVAPAQLVAAGSRSSIASLPALVEGARDSLGLPPLAAGFVLPFSVALFKLNRTASSAVKLLVLAQVLGISLHPAQLLVFLATEMVISFSSVGVPGGGGQLRSLPAYLALGMPIEGLLLYEAVDDIPDIAKTVTNVTGDMSVAAILCRPPATGEAA